MTHIDPDDLALIALSRSPQTDAAADRDLSAHLAACPDCATELHHLRRTVDLGRGVPVDLLSPPPAIWSRIHAELGLSPAIGAAAGPVAPGPGAVGPGATRPVAPAAVPVIALDQWRAERRADHRAEGRADRWAGRKRRGLPLVAAAAIGIIVGISTTLWWPAPRADLQGEQILAQGTLDALPGWTASGAASVARSVDGPREVTVTLRAGAEAATPGDEPLREVWLLTPDATGLVSLGLLSGDTGRFVIPDAVDLEEFPVLDVSAEANDGNPAHSGDSIVRGELVSGAPSG